MAFGPLSRRNFLRHVPAVAAAAGAIVSSVAIGIPAIEAATLKAAPTERDLARYYAFIWHEFFELSAEMGVEQHDAMTVYRFGDMDTIRETMMAPPSSRAIGVLSLLGVATSQVPSGADHYA